jgi:hypothetical protein
VVAEAGGIPVVVVVGTGVAVVTAGAAAVVAAGRRVTRALALVAGTGVRTTVVTRKTRRRWAVKAMPTAIGHLINHARLTRIIAATAAAGRGLNINAHSKPVGMVVPASRLVAFPPAAADSGARAALDRAGAGKYTE